MLGDFYFHNGNKMNEKPRRPIDRIRDGAGQMRVGDPGDDSPITGFFRIGDKRLFILKAAGVYEIVMADQIDPERENIDIPNVQQRVLQLGTDDPIIGKTIQLAEVLLRPDMLTIGVALLDAKTLCLEAAKHLGAMRSASDLIASAERAGLAALATAKAENRALALPSVPGLRSTVTGFIQSADHCLQQLLSLVEIFYGAAARKAWFESFAQLALAKYGKDDWLAMVSGKALPFLQFIRKARNCVEHEKPNERLVVRDFRLDARNGILPPTIEVIHPNFAQPETELAALMAEVTDHIASITAEVMAAMCSKFLVAQGAFPIAVGPNEKPAEDQRHVPYRYYVQIQGGWAPLN